MLSKIFNIVLTGVGGQGIITLARLLATAALIEGYDIKTSELHGLSQRGGSVETHLRFGRQVFSPLVKQAGADLIIALELTEALRACYYASKEAKTKFLVNILEKPIFGAEKTFSLKETEEGLKRFTVKAFLVPGSEIAKQELGKEVLSGVYLLGLAIRQKLIPLKPDSILEAMEKVVPQQYLTLNKKAFDLSLL